MGRFDFDVNVGRVKAALDSIDEASFSRLLDECEATLAAGHKIIASGLGKNEAICEKFVGTLLSLGFEAGYLNTSSAIHGDLGMAKDGDLVLLLSKSGATSETLFLFEQLKKRPLVQCWLISFTKDSPLAKQMDRRIIMDLPHEGDLWDVVPNNSSTVNLMVLQEIAMTMAKRFNLDVEKDFAPNHPGGAIGEKLKK